MFGENNPALKDTNNYYYYYDVIKPKCLLRFALKGYGDKVFTHG